MDGIYCVRCKSYPDSPKASGSCPVGDHVWVGGFKINPVQSPPAEDERVKELVELLESGQEIVFEGIPCRAINKSEIEEALTRLNAERREGTKNRSIFICTHGAVSHPLGGPCAECNLTLVDRCGCVPPKETCSRCAK